MTLTSSRLVVLVFLAGSVAACSGRAAESSQAASARSQSSAPTPAVAHGAPAGMPAQSGGQVVSGTVVETMNASNYTYVRVKTASGEIWAATSQFPVAVGDRVTVPLESPMQNFHSQSLNRDFPLIYFASQITRDGGVSSSPHGSPSGAATATQAEPIAAPTGGMSIAQVWADRQKLAGKQVTVRGKVVKYNGGILDRNWIHIQDGSGKAADGTNDLTLTSDDATSPGQVITASGTVAIDKDFGAGYAYKVMLEKATIKQ